jgi:hypothetical protein
MSAALDFKSMPGITKEMGAELVATGRQTPAVRPPPTARSFRRLAIHDVDFSAVTFCHPPMGNDIGRNADSEWRPGLIISGPTADCRRDIK